MFSLSRRGVAAILLALAAVAVLGSRLARAADEEKEKPLSPETIFEKQFEGPARVEFEVAEVHTLNIDSVFVPDVSHDLVIKAKTPAAAPPEFLVVGKRVVATRLLKLGIADPAEHFRGKVLRVSGTVELIKRPSTPPALVYRILVTNLDQLENIRKP
jgi:hypothetical protein